MTRWIRSKTVVFLTPIWGRGYSKDKLQIENQTEVDTLTRMFHELLSRDREDGRATGQPQGVGLEAYLNGTVQGTTPEDARKDGHTRGRSR